MDFEQTVSAARKFKSSALVTLLEYHAPRVQRLSSGLCGQVRLGRKVVRIVMAQALNALPKLRDAEAVERWFYHRTVLESRQHVGRASDESLRENAPRRDPAYLAFIAAYRSLPAQQREAVLLTYGERLSPRHTGAAMDCSADAAANHLRMGMQHLQAIGGAEFNALLEAMTATYQGLAPAQLTARREVRRRVHRFLLPRRVRRFVLLCVFIMLGYAMWRFRGTIRSIMP